jgi:hypothetical protein
MTATLGVSVRERWRSREMRIDRWHKQTGDRIRHGDTVVDLVVDGIPRSIVYTSALDQDPVVTLSWCYQGGGGEVGPWGQLGEYSNYEHAGAHPDHHEFRTYSRRESYPPIFISYRRLQAETFAGRLQAALAERLGRSAVFFDEASLRPGEDFAWTIQQAVWHAPVFLAILGAGWESSRYGERDFTTREIVAALDTGSTVIPVLLPDTPFSDRMTNLHDMARLTANQAFQLGRDEANWDADIARLADIVGELVPHG